MIIITARLFQVAVTPHLPFFVRGVQILLGRPDMTVPQEFLNSAEVDAPIEETCRKRVAGCVRSINTVWCPTKNSL